MYQWLLDALWQCLFTQTAAFGLLWLPPPWLAPRPRSPPGACPAASGIRPGALACGCRSGPLADPEMRFWWHVTVVEEQVRGRVGSPK
jgi:hypothetical protein